MGDARTYEVGPGFVRAKECPDCGHTRCGEDCVCNCDAARAESAAAHLRAQLATALRERDEARGLLQRALPLINAWQNNGYWPGGATIRDEAAEVEAAIRATPETPR